MKKYPDPDAICSEATALTAALVAMSIPGDADVRQQATRFQMCLDDEGDYDYYEFYLTGMALLRSLLRIRIRLKKRRPVPLLLQRYQLKLKLSGRC